MAHTSSPNKHTKHQVEDSSSSDDIEMTNKRDGLDAADGSRQENGGIGVEDGETKTADSSSDIMYGIDAVPPWYLSLVLGFQVSCYSLPLPTHPSHKTHIQHSTGFFLVCLARN